MEFGGPTSKGRGGEGKMRRGEGREWKGSEGRERDRSGKGGQGRARRERKGREGPPNNFSHTQFRFSRNMPVFGY